MARVMAEGITTWPSDPVALIGTRCGDCGHTTFPTQQWCPACSGRNLTDVELPRTGTVITWTTQGFYPGPGYVTDAKGFVPFAMGLVQLGDVIAVEGRLTETDPERLTFGMQVELIMVTVGTDPDGEDVLMFAFQPA